MLDALRASSQTWMGRSIMAVVMGFLIIAFGFWGIADIFRGFGANTLARVGSVDITPDQFRSAYQTQLLQMQEQQRRAISAQEAHEQGLDRQVLGRMLSDTALNLEAHRLGLTLPDSVIARQIMQDESFKGANGQFSKQVFESRLEDNGLTEQRYVTQVRGAGLRQEITSALTSGLAPPQAMLEIINRYYNEARNIDFLVLAKSTAGTIPAPTDAELKSYFESHRELYRQPEYRKLSVLVLDAKTLVEAQAAAHPITDADIQKRYDEVKDSRYTTAEKRTVQQIVFPDEKSADAASAKLAGGETFAALAAERKLTPKDTDLGTVTESGIADKNAAAAAFALASPGVTKPVKTQFGWAILNVENISPKIVIPLIGVRGSIAHDMAEERASKDLGKIHDKVEDARASGKSVADAAKAAGLPARTIDAIDAQGNDKSGHFVADLGDSAALVKAAFASDIGVDNDPVPLKDGGAIWFDVLNVTPARNQSFDEVKAKIRQDWTADETSRRLVDKAADLIKKIDSGTPFSSIAASLGNLPIKHVNKITRMDSQGLPRSLVDEIFNRSVGKGGSAERDDGGRVIFDVASASVPPLNAKHFDVRSMMDQMRTALDDDVTTQFVSLLENRLDTRINQSVWQNVSGSSDQQ